ncbi:MAG: enoyl-CoA hydratase/isomerase family protein [Pirellulales bacterium]|nr:enoyl-CoA hydratase/isomerase family protein [Pirellulales bacterium]
MTSNAFEMKIHGPVGTIILNRPDQQNALTQAMLEGLTQALDDFYLEKRVRAIVLTGKGNSFCAGMDAREISNRFQLPNAAELWAESASAYRELILRMLEVTKPIIASVNGPAVAGGAGLVLASDIVIADPNASFGLPDPQRGLVAGIVTPLAAFRLGAGTAARLALTGSLFPANEARQMGVYHELVDHDQLWARATEIGTACAAGAPEAIQLTKRLISETVGEQLAAQLSAGAAASATALTTDSAREGIAAFLEKRPPEWK